MFFHTSSLCSNAMTWQNGQVIIYISFSFFSLGLTPQEGVWESVISQVSHSHGITSHDECGKTVHRPCSSCISSIENLMGTLLSSPCQLRLGG